MIRRIAAIVGLLAALGATAAVSVAMWPERDDGDAAPAEASRPRPVRLPTVTNPLGGSGPRPEPSVGSPFALAPATSPLPVKVHLKRKPAAGVLFDVETGAVLWERHPLVERPIASLTKMMTAILVAEQGAPKDRVAISAKAAHTPGSATGVLPAGRKVPLEPLLEALIMISANDAAVALAENQSGTTGAFVKQMNERARVDGTLLHQVLHAQRVAGPRQPLLRRGPRGARPGRTRE